jgi:hypothetical protein
MIKRLGDKHASDYVDIAGNPLQQYNKVPDFTNPLYRLRYEVDYSTYLDSSRSVREYPLIYGAFGLASSSLYRTENKIGSSGNERS